MAWHELLFYIFVVSCSGKAESTDPTAGFAPVRECVEYQTALDSCFHRDSGLARDPAMIPKTSADRARIQQICTDNLARLKTACR